jgi:hypothetical protein
MEEPRIRSARHLTTRVRQLSCALLACCLAAPLFACCLAAPVFAQEAPVKEEALKQDAAQDRVQTPQTEPQTEPQNEPQKEPQKEPLPPAPPVARDTRTQFPAFLTNAFIGGQLAYLNYRFSERQLEPGFRSSYVAVPHLAIRVDLLGYRFSRFTSVQAVYMRPGAWVTYHNVNGDAQLHHVWMNFGAITMQAKAPLIADRLSAYVEGGFGIASRRGFEDDHGTPVVRHAHYGSPVLGAGLLFHAGPSWDLTTGVTYVPSRAEDKQPASAFVSTGVRYNVTRADPEGSVEPIDGDRYIFPANVVQLELSNGHGYGANKFFSSKVPIFWDGTVEIDRGLALHYERNVYHTRRFFALDFGTSVSFWRSRGLGDKFATLSVYPLLRFTLLRTRPADFFFMYSIAGPTYITKRFIDAVGTGGNFTFQDFLGAGVFVGKNRNVSLGLKITHYSNGNLFVDNAALKVPVTLNLGYAF